MRTWRISLWTLALVSLLVLGCDKNNDSVTATPPGETAQAAGAPTTPASKEGLAVSGPYASANLTVWLVHGPDTSKGRNYVTLAEAMEQKKVVVHETGDVNTLAIENVSDDVVFVPAGSIVKGGKQDRTLGTDLIITRADGKMPIDAFCVEQGRWRSRGDESLARFGENNAMVSGKSMKMAANSNSGVQDQREVWESVAKAQQRLQVAAAPEAAGAGGGRQQAAQQQALQAGVPMTTSEATESQILTGGTVNRAAIAREQTVVTSSESPTSYQLSMETEAVKKMTKDRRAAIDAALKGKKDVVGYVYAVDNKISGGSVYASPALFQKLWPLLADAAVVESITEAAPPQANGAPATQPALPKNTDVLSSITAPRAVTRKRDLNGQTVINAYDDKDSILLETIDKGNGAPAARSVLVKPDGANAAAPDVTNRNFRGVQRNGANGQNGTNEANRPNVPNAPPTTQP